MPAVAVLLAGLGALALSPPPRDGRSSRLLVGLYLLIPVYLAVQTALLGGVESLVPVPDEHQRLRSGSYLGFLCGALVLLRPTPFRRMRPWLLIALPVVGIASGLWATGSVLNAPGTRVGGTTNPVSFGYVGALNLVATAVLWRALPTPRRSAAALGAAGAVGYALAVVGSGTRGAWAALLAAALFLLWHRYWRRPGRLVGGIAALAVATAVLVQTPPVAGRVSEALDDLARYRSEQEYGSSVGARLFGWQVAVTRMIPESPLVGHGYLGYSASLDALVRRGEVPDDFNWTLHAHNELLHALVELGALGALALLIFYVGLWRACAALPDRSFALAGRALVLTAAVLGLTDLVTFNLNTATYLCVMSAFLLVASAAETEIDAATAGSSATP